jgi:hypothetical protein
MLLSPYHTATAYVALKTALYPTGTANGETIDRSTFGGDVSFVVLSGTLTNGTHTLTLEDAAATGGPWTAAPTKTLGTAVIAATDPDEARELRYTGAKRYVRIVNTTAAGAVGGYVGAVALVTGGRRPAVK